LKTAVHNEQHRSDNLLKVTELLSAINKLAVNESNQDKVVESGALDSYALLLETESSKDEQFAVAQGLWTLASHCPDNVLQHRRCVDGIRSDQTDLLTYERMEFAKPNVCTFIRRLSSALKKILLIPCSGRKSEIGNVCVCARVCM
jgi:hypothetical protein